MRRRRFDPSSGKIAHATGQVSPGASSTEPVPQSPEAAAAEPTRLEPGLCNRRSQAVRSPCTTAREEPTWQQRPGPARKKERGSLRGTQGGEKDEALWVRSSALWENRQDRPSEP